MPPIVPARRADAMPSAIPAAERKQKRCAGQKQRRRQALGDEARDAALLGVRNAEIAVENGPDINSELCQQRLVEAEFMPQLFEELRVGGARLPRHDRRGIARRQMDEHKIGNDDREHDGRHFDDRAARSI